MLQVLDYGDNCYMLHHVTGTDGQMELVMQGCWSVEDNCVNDTECVQSPAITHLNFCCCSQPLCNMHVKNVYYPPTTTAPVVTGRAIGCYMSAC